MRKIFKLESSSTSEKSSWEKRIHELDFFRGILILLVIFDHLMWFVNFYCFKNTQGFINWYWSSTLRKTVREIVLLAFLFTCGISCQLSRNNKKRGLLLLAISIAICALTHVIQLLPIFNNRVVIIDINILGVIALSILLYVACSKLSQKNFNIITGILMVFYAFIVISNKISSDTSYDVLQSVLGLSFNPIKAGLVADYLPLFPYVIALFLGVTFARKFYKEKSSLCPNLKRNFEKPVCFLGRHTLLIYIAHEIVFTLLFMGIGALIYR